MLLERVCGALYIGCADVWMMSAGSSVSSQDLVRVRISCWVWSTALSSGSSGVQPSLSTRFASSDARETWGIEDVCKDGAEELSCIPSLSTKHCSQVLSARRRLIVRLGVRRVWTVGGGGSRGCLRVRLLEFRSISDAGDTAGRKWVGRVLRNHFVPLHVPRHVSWRQVRKI